MRRGELSYVLKWPGRSARGTSMDSFFMSILKSLLRFFVALLIPFLLIFCGGGVCYLGLISDIQVVVWGGFALIGVGVFWLIAMFFSDSSSPFD